MKGITVVARAVGCVAFSMLGVFLSPLNAGTTYWVKPTGDDIANNGLSFGSAWKTITYAASQASPGDTIFVTAGDYNVGDNLETFPIPVPAGVQIRGATSAGFRPEPEVYPVIGGDVSAEEAADIRALFELVADGETVTGASLKWLRFAGESTEDEDAPHAVYVESLDTGVAGLTIDTCIFERSEMDDGDAANDRENVRAVYGEGNVTLTVVGCAFAPNLAGGIRVAVGSDCVDEQTSGQGLLTVSACTFTLTGAQASAFAIGNLLVTEGEARVVLSQFSLTNNVIDSSAFTGDGGFEYGILVGVSTEGASEEATSSLSIQPATGATVIDGNDITGTRVAAVKVLCEFIAHGGSNVQIYNINGNQLLVNEGDGLVFDFGATEDEGSAYFRCQTQCNLIAENRNGLMLLNAVDQNGGFHFFYDTIAWNRSHGVVIDASEGYITGWANSLNVFNSSGPYDSSVGWEPADVTYWDADENDWSGLASYYFVDAGNGDYHLHANADARNAGNNTPGGVFQAFMTRDLYGGDRIAETTTDLGADEYNP
jgi:hypothetical protein